MESETKDRDGGGRPASSSASDKDKAIHQRYAEYERRKQKWIAEHTNATQAEFDAAMTSIASECGV